PAHLPFVARFLTGRLVAPAWPSGPPELGASGALVFEAACAVSGASPTELGTRARRAGDLGTAVGEALAIRLEQARAAGAVTPTGLVLPDAERLGRMLVESKTRADKLRALTDALAACTALEARYVVRAVIGEMRVGAREGMLEDAVAKAFGRPLADV